MYSLTVSCDVSDLCKCHSDKRALILTFFSLSRSEQPLAVPAPVRPDTGVCLQGSALLSPQGEEGRGLVWEWEAIVW